MIELYSKVKLITGEIGYVIESYKNGEYEVELEAKDHHLNLKTVRRSEIAEEL